MIAIMYLVLCTAFGLSLLQLLLPNTRRLIVACAASKKTAQCVPSAMVTVPCGITIGLITVTFVHYYVTLALAYYINNPVLCKNVSILVVFAIFLWLILTNLIIVAKRKNKEDPMAASLPGYKRTVAGVIFYALSIVLCTVAATFLMFYTYRIDGATLQAGYSTYSDLSPHTAMVSSFGVGFNIPTQYMHFAGSGIQYHFFFYFLCGMLEYMGMPLDYAINVPSIIVMCCAMVLLGLLAILISGRRLAFLIAPILVFFRSSFNVFVHIKDLMGSGLSLGDSINEISQSASWYDLTPYDGWGIWAINVYPNQRHLMLGVAVILMLILFFLPHLRRMGTSFLRYDSANEALKYFFWSRNAWLPRRKDPLNSIGIALTACLVVVVMPYFHGSALIAALLVLFGMAIFSEARLLYLATAVCAVISSFIQTRIFSGGAGNVISLQRIKGFVIQDYSATDTVKYIVTVTGLTLIIAFICVIVIFVKDIIKRKPVYRFFLLIAMMIPFIFAFNFQVTLEMLANHKFIQISLILADAFVACALANMFYLPFKIRGAAEETVAAESSAAEAQDSEVASSDGAEDAPEEEKTEETEETKADAEEAPAEEKPQEILFGDEEAPADQPDKALALTESSGTDTPAKISFPGKEDEEEKSEEESSETPEESDSEGEKPEEEEKAVFEHKPIEDKPEGLSLPVFIVLQVICAALAFALLIPLTATGISEWCTYYNLNKGYVTVNMDSPMTKWIIENTDEQDIFLTPCWALNRFSLSGRAMYYGWPYYAWSAGHDTETRNINYAWLASGCDGDVNEFIRYCKERHIRYVIDDPDFYSQELADGRTYNHEFFAENFTTAAYFADDNGTTIYRVY